MSEPRSEKSEGSVKEPSETAEETKATEAPKDASKKGKVDKIFNFFKLTLVSSSFVAGKFDHNSWFVCKEMQNSKVKSTIWQIP